MKPKTKTAGLCILFSRHWKAWMKTTRDDFQHLLSLTIVISQHGINYISMLVLDRFKLLEEISLGNFPPFFYLPGAPCMGAAICQRSKGILDASLRTC